MKTNLLTSLAIALAALVSPLAAQSGSSSSGTGTSSGAGTTGTTGTSGSTGTSTGRSSTGITGGTSTESRRTGTGITNTTGSSSSSIQDGITYHNGQPYMIRGGRATLLDPSAVPNGQILGNDGRLSPFPSDFSGFPQSTSPTSPTSPNLNDPSNSGSPTTTPGRSNTINPRSGIDRTGPGSSGATRGSGPGTLNPGAGTSGGAPR